jgi:hypothetical protein
MTNEEAFQWLVAGHAALIVERSKCRSGSPFADILVDFQDYYSQAMLCVLRNEKIDCAFIIEMLRRLARMYLKGRGVAGISYLPPNMRRQILYFGARYALTLVTILENVDWK